MMNGPSTTFMRSRKSHIAAPSPRFAMGTRVTARAAQPRGCLAGGRPAVAEPRSARPGAARGGPGGPGRPRCATARRMGGIVSLRAIPSHRPLEPPWPHPAVSTPSSPSPATAGSSSRPVRSTAARGRRGTTGRSASSSRRTSRRSGGATWCTSRDDIVGLDSSVILPKQVWEASGHVGVFTDPLVECRSCHKRFRADHLLEEFEEKKGRAPENGLRRHRLPELRHPAHLDRAARLQLMLKTFLGPVEDESGLHYLRPETAQGIFVNFANVLQAARMKPPFGIGQIGKRFRNEITPGATSSSARASSSRWRWSSSSSPAPTRSGTSTGSTSARPGTSISASTRENLRLFEHPKEKLSHYSKRTVDIEYRFGFTGGEWGELEGIANRTDFDLTHALRSTRARTSRTSTRRRTSAGCRTSSSRRPA